MMAETLAYAQGEDELKQLKRMVKKTRSTLDLKIHQQNEWQKGVKELKRDLRRSTRDRMEGDEEDRRNGDSTALVPASSGVREPVKEVYSRLQCSDFCCK